MDALDLRRARLIAHDWGGHAAFLAAPQAPERVSHLLAVNAAHPWLRQRQLLPQLWRFWPTAFSSTRGLGGWCLATRRSDPFCYGVAQRTRRVVRSAVRSRRSGKVRSTRRSYEGQELLEFRISAESLAAQLFR